MEAIFGVSAELVARALLAISALVLGALLVLALRQPVLLRIALRNLPRRPQRSILTVLGLALSTAVVTTAFGTGDTMGYTIRTLVTGSLGTVDEVVAAYPPSQRPGPGYVEALVRGQLPGTTGSYFNLSEWERIRNGLAGFPAVAGAAPAIVASVNIANTDQQLLAPNVNLIALPPGSEEALGGLRTLDGEPVALGDLADDEVYLNAGSGWALLAQPGDNRTLYFSQTRSYPARVRAVVRDDGPGGQQPVLFVPLVRAQGWQNRPGQINQILIANAGDAGTSVLRSDEVVIRLRALLLDDRVARRLHQALRDDTVDAQLAQLIETKRARSQLKLMRFRELLREPETTDELKSYLADPNTWWEIRSIYGRVPATAQSAIRGLRENATLAVIPVKQLAQEQADDVASVVTGIFLVLGTFSVATGLAVVWLVFVTLAAERRTEMGIARAIGTQQGQLVQMFAFEGMAYTLVASALGVLLGIGIGEFVVGLLQSYFSDYGVRVVRNFETRTLLIAYCLGALLTFAVVTFSAWRVSRLNIVTAVRNLAEAPRPAPSVRALIAGLWARESTDTRADVPNPAGRGVGGRLLALPGRTSALLWGLTERGVLVAPLGFWAMNHGARSMTPILYGLGVTLVIVAAALGLRWALRVAGWPRGPAAGAATRDRLVFSLLGLALIAYWTRPLDSWGPFQPARFYPSIEIYVPAGLVMVAGAVLVVAFNLELALQALRLVAARWSTLATPLRLAAAYPQSARFRAGLTVGMFVIVVFTMVLAAVLLTGTNRAFADLDALSGGFDIKAEATTYNAISNLREALAEAPAVKPEDFVAYGAMSTQSVEAIQIGASRAVWRSYQLNLVDADFLDGITAKLTHRAPGYATDAAVWQAVRDTPGLAVISGTALRPAGGDTANARASNGRLVLEGFASDRPEFAPTTIWVRDSRQGRAVPLTVIGVVDARGLFTDGLLTTPASVERANLPQPNSTNYFFRVTPGVNVRQAALGLSLSLAEKGVRANPIAEDAKRIQGVRVLLNYLLQGFIGLGLLAGVAALGVISSRAVVERRAQIGVLRAIGARRGAIQLLFLAESSTVATLGILCGIGLGLALSLLITRFLAGQNPEITFAVPWDQIGLIALIGYGAALLTTLLPAWQAGRVAPADAVRSE